MSIIINEKKNIILFKVQIIDTIFYSKIIEIKIISDELKCKHKFMYIYVAGLMVVTS